MLLSLKLFAVIITFIAAITLALIGWRRVPESKKNQRVYMYIAALLFLIMSALMLFYGIS